MQEHARVLRADLISIASSLDAAKSLYDYEPTRFESLMRLQASLHGLQSAYLLDKNGNVIVRTEVDPTVKTVMPTPAAIDEARKETAVLLQPGQSNQVGGLLKLRSYDETYLYIVRLLDKQVLDNLKLARDSAMEYRELENNRSDVQMGFAIIFGGMSIVFLLGAMWIGLSFANYLVAPIRHLINCRRSGGARRPQRRRARWSHDRRHLQPGRFLQQDDRGTQEPAARADLGVGGGRKKAPVH